MIKFEFPTEKKIYEKAPCPLGVGVRVKYQGVEYSISSVVYNLDNGDVEVFLSPRENYFTKLPHLSL